MAGSGSSHEGASAAMTRVLATVGARGLGVRRLCCLVTALLQELDGSGPVAGTGLPAEGAACNCGASRTEEMPWRTGCQAS